MLPSSVLLGASADNTIVSCEVVLFSGFGSGSAELMVAIFVIIPALVGFTMIVKLAVSPLATWTLEQLMAPVVSAGGAVHAQSSGAMID